MHLTPRRSWRPTDTALMLWMLVAAMLVGFVVSVVFGHPVNVMP
jgi:hypothetical protein